MTTNGTDQRSEQGRTKRPVGSAHDEQSAKTIITGGETSSAASPVERNDESASQAWVGRTLGKYEITALLGSGAMGVVYKAHDTTIERDVAIKILPRELAQDQTTLQRFLAAQHAACTHAETRSIPTAGNPASNEMHDLAVSVTEKVSDVRSI